MSCIDKGCDHSDPKAFKCECLVLSTDDPSNKDGTREEGAGPVVVDPDRWYMCYCSCSYLD